MAEVNFGSEGDTSGANKGDEAVVNDPIIETDGDRMTVTVTPEQAEAVRQLLAEKKEENNDDPKPEWLGDFKSPEEMAKAYKELRTKMSEGKKEEADPEAAQSAEDEAKEKGVDLDKYVKEYSATNELSSESYAELEAAGMTKDVVDNYIAGRLAGESAAAQGLYDVAGGEEGYQQLLEWGKANIPTDQQAAYDALLGEGNYDAAKLVLRSFVNSYKAANGSEPSSLNVAAQDGGGGAVQGFTSKADMIDAINDPRYKNGDKGYIAQVEKRILASSF